MVNFKEIYLMFCSTKWWFRWRPSSRCHGASYRRNVIWSFYINMYKLTIYIISIQTCPLSFRAMRLLRSLWGSTSIVLIFRSLWVLIAYFILSFKLAERCRFSILLLIVYLVVLSCSYTFSWFSCKSFSMLQTKRSEDSDCLVNYFCCFNCKE